DLRNPARAPPSRPPPPPPCPAPPRARVTPSGAWSPRRRNRVRSELIKQGRGSRRLPRSSPDSYGQPPGAETISKESAAQLMATQLDQLARDARERGAAAGRCVGSWAWGAIAAIVVPAIALVLVVEVFR